MEIHTQYDKDGMAGEYAKASLETKEHDFGRRFLNEEVAKSDKSSHILDIGCGDGIDLKSYKEMGFQYLYGADPSLEFITKAKESLRESASLSCGTFEELPFEDQKFDVVVSRFALHYCKNIIDGQKEAARVLKRGGVFVVVMANPVLDALQEKDAKGNITMSLFKGKVSITYPPHTVSEIFSDDFFDIFELKKVREYVGIAIDDNVKNLPDGLCFVAVKK